MLVLIAAVTVGCSSGAPAYRDGTALGSLSVGEPKEAVLATFSDRDRDAQNRPIRVAAIRIRAVERTPDGNLLEIGEIPLIDRASGRLTYYWILFQNGRLAVWGRPEDWRVVSGRYPIRFTPTSPRN